MVPAASVYWVLPCSVVPAAVTVTVPGLTALYRVTVVKLRSRPSVFEPAVTVTEVWCIDAWMTRTSALCAGVVSRSSSTCSFRPENGPTPATVYASPETTSMVVDRTGFDEADAPAARMATVYSPLATDSYGDTSP